VVGICVFTEMSGRSAAVSGRAVFETCSSPATSPTRCCSASSRTWSGARNFLSGGGVVYLVLWIYGMLIGHDSRPNFVPLNIADQLAAPWAGHRHDRPWPPAEP
jgi:hypothetical protein